MGPSTLAPPFCFVLQVMIIVFLQLCVTVGVAATFMFVQPLRVCRKGAGSLRGRAAVEAAARACWQCCRFPCA